MSNNHKSNILDRTCDTLHVIPAHTKVVMYIQAINADSRLGELLHSEVLTLDRVQVFNGSCLEEQAFCSCNCGQELAIFYVNSCEHQATFCQANIEDINSMSRTYYENNFRHKAA